MEMDYDLEDVGGDLAVFLETRCTNDQASHVASKIGFKIGSLLGAKKRRTQIRSELAMILTAEIIRAVNEMYYEDDAKLIIDEFLAQSKRNVFDGIAKIDSEFSDKYPERLTEYFKIMDQEDQILIGLSGSLLRHLGLFNKMDLNAQLGGYWASLNGAIQQYRSDITKL
jgi:hypothetical protein